MSDIDWNQLIGIAGSAMKMNPYGMAASTAYRNRKWLIGGGIAAAAATGLGIYYLYEKGVFRGIIGKASNLTKNMKNKITDNITETKLALADKTVNNGPITKLTGLASTIDLSKLKLNYSQIKLPYDTTKYKSSTTSSSAKDVVKTSASKIKKALKLKF
jgi:hypothetical protein